MNRSASDLIARLNSRTIYADIVVQKKNAEEGRLLRPSYINDFSAGILANYVEGLVETTPQEFNRYIASAQGSSSLPQTPAAPTILYGTSASGEVTIVYTPGSDGGSPITNYEYSINGGTSYSAFSPATGAISTLTITGLTNGTTYSIKLKGVNSVGSGAASDVIYITPLPGSQLVLFLDGAFVDDPLAALWRDSSGKMKNGTIYNAPYWDNVNGGRYDFNGANQYVGVPQGFNDFSTGITVLAFASFTSSPNTWERIIDFGNGAENNNILLSREGTTGNLRFQLYNGVSQAISLDVNLTNGIIEDSWGFYVARLDGTNYLLKNQNSSTTGTTSILPASVVRTNNYIGRSNWVGDAYFKRYIGIVAIYSGALTDGEIGDFFNLYKARYFAVPAAPTSLVGTIGNGQVSIAFTAGSDSGSPITNYEYSINGGSYSAFSPADTASPVFITGLTNGTTYEIRLRAVNVIGAGTASDVLPITPATPDAFPVIDGKTLLFRLEGNNTTSYPGSGTTWFDIDNGTTAYNGTLVNTPTFNSSTAGGVFTFNSAQLEYVQIADNVSLRATTGASNYKSVVIWVYNTTDTSTGIFSKQSSSNDFDGYSITFNTNRRLTLNMNGRSVNGNYVTPSTNVYNLSEWTMITGIVCFGGSTGNPCKLYVNTTEVLSVANNESGVIETNPIRFPEGIQGYSSYSSCSIGAVYYYNGVLTSSDISALYNGTKARYGL